MYILASDLFWKRLWIRIFWLFQQKKHFVIIDNYSSKNFKSEVKPGFSVHNNPFNMWGQVDNSKWILCNRKTGLKYKYLDLGVKNKFKELFGFS